jgi:hypothetical protein
MASVPSHDIHGAGTTMIMSSVYGWKPHAQAVLTSRIAVHVFDICRHVLQQAALEAVCGATPAVQLLADNALLPAWRAVASTLQRCSEVMLYTAAL